MSEERENLAKELEDARARIARLEQEAETNRAFFARTLDQVHAAPRRGDRPTVWHGLAWAFGVGCGIIVTLALLVARGEPPPMAPPPPPRPKVPLAGPQAPVLPADAGALVAAADSGVSAPAAAAPRAERPDDSGTLNVTSTAQGAAVILDGKPLGATPQLGVKVRPGEHVVKFLCHGYDDRQSEQKVNVPPFAEVDVEFRCE